MWLPVDLALAVSLERLLEVEAAERCSRCGTFAADWFDETGAPSQTPTYQVTTRDCEGCRRILRAQRDLQGDDHDGEHVVLRPITANDIEPGLTETALAAHVPIPPASDPDPVS